MIYITYIGKTHTATLELEREISASGWWIPNGATIRIDAPEPERYYVARPSPLYEKEKK